jgi:hypothetical protein
MSLCTANFDGCDRGDARERIEKYYANNGCSDVTELPYTEWVKTLDNIPALPIPSFPLPYIS